MHELSLTRTLVDMVASRAQGRRVAAVHVRVGRLAGVVPESMAFCFDVVTAGTPLDGARLEMDVVDGRQRCRDCGRQDVAEHLILLCPCGSAAVDLVAGDDLTLTAVELFREPECA